MDIKVDELSKRLELERHSIRNLELKQNYSETQNPPYFQIPNSGEMGLLWWRNKPTSDKKPAGKPDPKPTEAPGMNGAVEVPRRPPSEVTVFEFGSVAASTDKVTLAGYCPVSDELEPCRWEILPAKDSDAPQFRIVF